MGRQQERDRQTEAERQRQTVRDRGRQRQTERETDRQRERERQTDRQSDRDRETNSRSRIEPMSITGVHLTCLTVKAKDWPEECRVSLWSNGSKLIGYLLSPGDIPCG